MFYTPQYSASPYYQPNQILICQCCQRPFLPNFYMQPNSLIGQDTNLVGADHGNQPYVVNIEEVSIQNNNYRTAIWTGEHLQVTVMSIDQEVGLEVHPDVDQFLRIEEGTGVVKMGKTKNNMTFESQVKEDDAIFIPAGAWHNLINIGNKPIKLYSIYAPPEHPFGTVHVTKADEAEGY